MSARSEKMPQVRPFRSTWRGAPRLPAGVALIVVCLFGMVALPRWYGDKSAELREEIRATLAPLEITLERLHRDVVGMASDLRGYLLTGDASLASAFENEEREASLDFRRARTLARRSGAPIARELAAAERAYVAWLVGSRIVLGLEGRETPPADLQRLHAENQRRLEAFSSHMDRLDRLARAQEDELRSRLVAFQKAEDYLLLVLGTLAAIVVGYLTWLTVALLRAERAAVQERDQLEAVLAAVDSCIVLLDRELRVLAANDCAQEILGFSRAELVGCDFHKVLREGLKPWMADPEAFERRLVHLHENSEAAAEEILELSGPEPRTLSRYSAPVRDEAGAVLGRIEVFRDVTDSLRRERELAEANERKDRFLATLSHELRTPLTPIFGWIELLKGERDPEAIAKGLDRIHRNARLQAQLVEDLLDLSRVVNQKLHLDLRPVNVASAVEAAVDTVRHLAEAKQVELETHLDGAPGTVVADETRLVQVLWNLLSNAIKFSRPGARVVLEAGTDRGRLWIGVEDQGEGIAAEVLEHIFKPFEQPQRATPGRRGGLGIGLALSRSLVELHGGALTAESGGTGKGARFTFWIPATPPTARRAPTGGAGASRSVEGEVAAAMVQAGDEKKRREGEARGRVLIVEDDRDTCEAMRILLASWGYEVSAAADAASALETVRCGGPGVVISDIGMPGMDGLAFARAVRRHEGSRETGRDGESRTLLVAITGFASESDRRRALAAGFDAYLTKPVDFEALKILLECLVPAAEPLRT